jgi:hypothetical protein
MNSIAPRPNSASTAHRRTISSGLAKFDGTSRPSCATWMSSCDVEKPIAPSRIAWRTSAHIASISASVAARSEAASPMT